MNKRTVRMRTVRASQDLPRNLTTLRPMQSVSNVDQEWPQILFQQGSDASHFCGEDSISVLIHNVSPTDISCQVGEVLTGGLALVNVEAFIRQRYAGNCGTLCK